MVVYYFITPDAQFYQGTAVYEKYRVPKDLSRDAIIKLYNELAKRIPGFLGLFYNTDTGEFVIWYVKQKSLQWQIPLIIGLIGAIAGLVAGVKLEQSGEGQWSTTNPPGVSFSLWDLIKLGLLAFVVYMFAKTITDVILAVREKKPMPTPYEVFVAPAVPYVKGAVEYAEKTAEKVAPYVVKGAKYVISTVKRE